MCCFRPQPTNRHPAPMSADQSTYPLSPLRKTTREPRHVRQAETVQTHVYRENKSTPASPYQTHLFLFNQIKMWKTYLTPHPLGYSNHPLLTTYNARWALLFQGHEGGGGGEGMDTTFTCSKDIPKRPSQTILSPLRQPPSVKYSDRDFPSKLHLFRDVNTATKLTLPRDLLSTFL